MLRLPHVIKKDSHSLYKLAMAEEIPRVLRKKQLLDILVNHKLEVVLENPNQVFFFFLFLFLFLFFIFNKPDLEFFS